MPSERKPHDQGDVTEPEEPRATAADDADVPEENDESDALPGLVERPDVEPTEPVDAPRNRAERRAADRQARRGRVQATGTAPGATTSSRLPRVQRPPRSQTGKSSADEVPPWARGVVDSLVRHRRVLVIGAAAVLLATAGGVWWTVRRERRFAEAAGFYSAAVRASNSPVRPPDAPAEPAPTDGTVVYPDYAARSRAALESSRQVAEKFADAPIAPLAKLTEGGELYDLGRYREAQRALEVIIPAAAEGKLAGEEGRVYEILGFTLEAQNDFRGALRRYEEMARVAGGAFRDLAQFHQARAMHRLEQTAQAKDTLHGLIQRLGATGTDVAGAAMASPSVLEQARALLHDIDPDDPLGRRAEATDTESLMRMLRQRMRGARPSGQPGGSEQR